MSEMFPSARLFKPKGRHLLSFLKRKLDHPNGISSCFPIVHENIYNFHPQELAGMYMAAGKDKDVWWYFMTPRTRRFRNGTRPDRMVANKGFWRTTGRDIQIHHREGFVGKKMVLAFYEVEGDNKKKTNWIMHEYQIEAYQKPITNGEDWMKLDECVIAKIRLRKCRTKGNDCSGSSPVVSMLKPKVSSEAMDPNNMPLQALHCFTFNDQELLSCLKRKLDQPNWNSCFPIVLENIYKFHPQELTGLYMAAGEGDVWYFMTPRTRRYRNGTRPDRRVANKGYWKATGGDNKIHHQEGFVGKKMVLVFYEGDKKKTNWIMHEYQIEAYQKPITNGQDCMKLDDWVLAKIRLRKCRSQGNDCRGSASILETEPPVSSDAEASSEAMDPNCMPLQALPPVYDETNACSMSFSDLLLLPDELLFPSSYSNPLPLPDCSGSSPVVSIWEPEASFEAMNPNNMTLQALPPFSHEAIMDPNNIPLRALPPVYDDETNACSMGYSDLLSLPDELVLPPLPAECSGSSPVVSILDPEASFEAMDPNNMPLRALPPVYDEPFSQAMDPNCMSLQALPPFSHEAMDPNNMPLQALPNTTSYSDLPPLPDQLELPHAWSVGEGAGVLHNATNGWIEPTVPESSGGAAAGDDQNATLSYWINVLMDGYSADASGQTSNNINGGMDFEQQTGLESN